MSKKPIPDIASDFSEVLKLLQSRGIIAEKPDQASLLAARKIHTATFSLILWRFRLQKLPVHGSVFIDEIASDALQVLPQVMMGYGKPAILLIRGIVENALRHLYFLDHPIEFERMNREAKWFMTIDSLFEYGKAHPQFYKIDGQQFNVFAMLSSLYSELSAGVHGRTVKDLEMRSALEKITYDQTVANKMADSVAGAAEATNFLLAMLHRESVEKFRAEDKRIILRSMRPSARAIWRHHE